MNFVNTTLAVLFALILFVGLSRPNGLGPDDTDGKNRSGLMLYVDNKTGVQYVGTALGGLTVRLDENGKPMKVGER